MITPSSLNPPAATFPAASPIEPESIPGHEAASSEYERFVVSQLGLIRALAIKTARSQRMSAAETEDFVADVMVHLIDGDFAVLRKFRRQSSFRTFLHVVIRRLCLDVRTAQWGKWRPSARSRRAGRTALLLERLMVRDGLSFAEAGSVLRTNHGLDVDERTLEQHRASFKTRWRAQFVSESRMEHEAIDQSNPEKPLVDRNARRTLLAAIATTADTFRRLPNEDREMLVLHFRDGLTVAAIARRLGVNQRGLYGRLTRALKRLRRALEQAQFRKEDVLDAVTGCHTIAADIFTPSTTGG